MHVAIRFILSARAAYLVLAALFAALCRFTGHTTSEMLYGATASITLAAAAALAAVWYARD